VRITVDTNIRYKKPNKFNNFLLRGSYAILEIKYESNDYNIASDILSSLPNALEKNSKYVVGLSSMYHKMIV
jgi:SPX domain protein involved in polyphosphate accumulation